MSTLTHDPKSAAVNSIHHMADGTLQEFADLYHPDAFTRERNAAPPAARGHGPEAFFALASWLRAAFTDYRYDIHTVVAEADHVTVDATMHGRHIAPIAFYTDAADVDIVFAPTGKTFAITQSHWFRMHDGLIAEHWANRDDLGMARQAGWVPPTPLYLLKCGRLKRQARKALR
jgi:predicted ester cyclase